MSRRCKLVGPKLLHFLEVYSAAVHGLAIYLGQQIHDVLGIAQEHLAQIVVRNNWQAALLFGRHSSWPLQVHESPSLNQMLADTLLSRACVDEHACLEA